MTVGNRLAIIANQYFPISKALASKKQLTAYNPVDYSLCYADYRRTTRI